MGTLPTSAWDTMYAKFPRKAPPCAVAPLIVPCAVEQKPVPRSIAPPAGTPRQGVSSTSFGDYYRKHSRVALQRLGMPCTHNFHPKSQLLPVQRLHPQPQL